MRMKEKRIHERMEKGENMRRGKNGEGRKSDDERERKKERNERMERECMGKKSVSRQVERGRKIRRQSRG